VEIIRTIASESIVCLIYQYPIIAENIKIYTKILFLPVAYPYVSHANVSPKCSATTSTKSSLKSSLDGCFTHRESYSARLATRRPVQVGAGGCRTRRQTRCPRGRSRQLPTHTGGPPIRLGREVARGTWGDGQSPLRPSSDSVRIVSDEVSRSERAQTSSASVTGRVLPSSPASRAIRTAAGGRRFARSSRSSS